MPGRTAASSLADSLLTARKLPTLPLIWNTRNAKLRQKGRLVQRRRGSSIINGVNTYVPSSTAFCKSQDGYTDGLLSSIQFDTQGRIMGTFTNQQTIAIGQVAIADPNNEAGLDKGWGELLQPDCQ